MSDSELDQFFADVFENMEAEIQHLKSVVDRGEKALKRLQASWALVKETRTPGEYERNQDF